MALRSEQESSVPLYSEGSARAPPAYSAVAGLWRGCAVLALSALLL